MQNIFFGYEWFVCYVTDINYLNVYILYYAKDNLDFCKLYCAKDNFCTIWRTFLVLSVRTVDENEQNYKKTFSAYH